MCASLVDKVQNLAGIARTSEIFAVENLVLGDKSVTKSDVFQNIAVTADSWIPMSEVKPKNLLAYLQDMRKKGYEIVGLEQTDSSVILGGADVVLPQKCVLLLGKEKEGIPVEFLNEVTVTVEIPQLGVIRSLNVHVSAAIAIWEITKQNQARG